MNNKIEVTAVGTNGLWYAYVSDADGKIYSGTVGFEDREDAIADGNYFLEVHADTLTGE